MFQVVRLSTQMQLAIVNSWIPKSVLILSRPIFHFGVFYFVWIFCNRILSDNQIASLLRIDNIHLPFALLKSFGCFPLFLFLGSCVSSTTDIEQYFDLVAQILGCYIQHLTPRIMFQLLYLHRIPTIWHLSIICLLCGQAFLSCSMNEIFLNLDFLI